MRLFRSFVPSLFTLCALALLVPGAACAQAPVYVLQWGTFGSGPGQFFVPAGIATNPAGEVFVADQNNERIQKFTTTGGFLAQWGVPGSSDGQFASPNGIAVGPDGTIYVADVENDRIQRFSATGTILGR